MPDSGAVEVPAGGVVSIAVQVLGDDGGGVEVFFLLTDTDALEFAEPSTQAASVVLRTKVASFLGVSAAGIAVVEVAPTSGGTVSDGSPIGKASDFAHS